MSRSSAAQPSGPPAGRGRRDRRGRGLRGPVVVPADPRQPVLRTARERFDDLTLSIVTEIDERWQARLGLIEYAVEETPEVPDDGLEEVPLGSVTKGTGSQPTRLVVYRQPVEHRCEGRAELEAMILMVVVEQVADLLGVDAEVVDPRYQRDF